MTRKCTDCRQVYDVRCPACGSTDVTNSRTCFGWEHCPQCDLHFCDLGVCLPCAGRRKQISDALEMEREMRAGCYDYEDSYDRQ